jgi:hypothetical protein
MTSAVEAALARANRAIASSRALWRDGLMPEAQASLASALRALLDAWAPPPADASSESAGVLAGAEAASEPAIGNHAAALDDLGRAGYRTLERLRRVAGSSAAMPADAPASSIGPEFELLAAEVERLYGFTRRRRAPRLTERQRRVRLVAALVAVLVAALVLVWRLWLRPTVTASAVYSWDHPASLATDGIDATEWLLPDRTTGWVEIRFPWKRSIRHVRLLNAHNVYWMDRATERVRVTAYGPHSKLATVEGRFTQLSGKKNPLDLTLHAEGVTRLRVEVLSYFASGGGLAEVEWR